MKKYRSNPIYMYMYEMICLLVTTCSYKGKIIIINITVFKNHELIYWFFLVPLYFLFPPLKTEPGTRTIGNFPLKQRNFPPGLNTYCRKTFWLQINLQKLSCRCYLIKVKYAWKNKHLPRYQKAYYKGRQINKVIDKMNIKKTLPSVNNLKCNFPTIVSWIFQKKN